ncbi:hypothetical protein J6N69_00455 [bacterium]|nr:hypothetical protein [bacterium]MBP3846951.1 hypothetical protein [bacterium]
MFNFVNGNPFNKKIESALSTGQENKRQQQQQKEDEERRYLEDDDQDEVSISQRPELTEDDVLYLMNEYINKRKSEHEDNPKIVEKLDKYKNKFDVKKFMKRNPHLTVSDFNMIMFNETSEMLN